MKKYLRTPNLLLVLGLLVLVSTISSAEETPVKLQLKPLLGEELIYRMEIIGNTTLPTGEVTVTKAEGKVNSICVQVDDEGVKKVVEMISFGLPEIKIEKASPERLKMLEKSWKSEEFKRMYSATGKQLSITRSRPDGTVVSKTFSPMALMGRQEMTEPQMPIFPDEPVNVGESWTEDIKGINLKGTLLGFEDVQSYKCAKIQFEFIGKNPTEKTPTEEVTNQSVTFTAFIAIEEGFLVRLVTSTTVGGAGKYSGTSSLTTELNERHKLSPDELKQAQKEVKELEIGFAHLKKQDQDAAKASFQQFLEAHPESRFREGVEGLIAQIGLMEKKQVKTRKE